jgi:hypothetical protein
MGAAGKAGGVARAAEGSRREIDGQKPAAHPRRDSSVDPGGESLEKRRRAEAEEHEETQVEGDAREGVAQCTTHTTRGGSNAGRETVLKAPSGPGFWFWFWF